MMKGKKIRIALTILFAAVFCVSTGMVLSIWLRGEREEAAFDELAAIVHGTSAVSGGTGASSSVQSGGDAPAAESAAESALQSGTAGTADEPEPGLAALTAMNPDCFGWLEIPGTGVDYPVMFTPEDPEHYLRRAFDGSWAQSGVPFLDGSWTPEGKQYIIYGHNMDNGTMFAPLLRYADADFCREHGTLVLETIYEASAEYEIFAAFRSKAYDVDDEGVFRYYRYTNLSAQEDFESFVSQCLAASLYDFGVTPQYGDTIVTLSTCSYHTDEGRFVVAARRAGQEE